MSQQFSRRSDDFHLHGSRRARFFSQLPSLFACGLVFAGVVAVQAQGVTSDQLYGQGVHAYFARDFSLAHRYLSTAARTGSTDPRVYYFQGLASLSLGQRRDAAEAFDHAVKLELADGSRSREVNKALERVQGQDRMLIERQRSQGRVLARQDTNRRRYQVIPEPILRASLLTPRTIERPRADGETPAPAKLVVTAAVVDDEPTAPAPTGTPADDTATFKQEADDAMDLSQVASSPLAISAEEGGLHNVVSEEPAPADQVPEHTGEPLPSVEGKPTTAYQLVRNEDSKESQRAETGDQPKQTVATSPTTSTVGNNGVLVASAPSSITPTENALPSITPVDTVAAQEARAALQAIEQAYGQSLNTAAWSQSLALPDVKFELQAGESARPSVLARTAAQLRKGRTGPFRQPMFQRLATALERRAAELTPIPQDLWPAECYRQAKINAVVTTQDLAKSSVGLKKRLDALERRLPAVRNPKSNWAKLLCWTETKDLAHISIANAAALDRLDAAWRGAPLVWNATELVEAALAVESYIRQYRSYLASESAEQHATAWNELGDLVKNSATQDLAGSRRMAEMVSGREQLGQGVSLTSSIRREFSRPNIIFRAQTKWVEAQLAQELDQRYDVNDVFAGARTYGSGTLKGRTRFEILPSNAVGRAAMRLDGSSFAFTNGYREGVRVSSRASTRVHGEMPFVLDAAGLLAGQATATADTSIAYTGIDAPGLARRRNEAIRQTYAMRPSAEADAEASTKRSITAELNAGGRELVTTFNRSYHAIRDRQISLRRPPPEIRVLADDKTVRWECRLESPRLFAAPSAPPEFAPESDAVLSIASSALEEQCLATLSGRTMTGDELSQALGSLFGTSDEVEKRSQDFHATFADHPCDVRLANGQLSVRFYVTSFDSADVQYSAMTIDSTYNVENRDGDVAVVREGRLHVKPWSAEGDPPALSGRRQTLRLAVERKLNKALPASFVWSSPSLSISAKDSRKLRVEQLRVDDGWLQLAFRPEGKSRIAAK